ncbi:KOW motif-containing protein [Candidatus Saccharibacteria bacterium]|nr:KOW motif-containing protein [Candidatus Saccharibacteria bacterium]MBQ9016812.1 KOW motif-containing protein [Candidatus Saccharibacteria bacterium]
MAQNLKTGDIVKVLSGDHKGKTAKIVKMDRKNGKAMLEGINVIERHLGKTPMNPQGGKKTVHVGIDLSNLKKEEKK